MIGNRKRVISRFTIFVLALFVFVAVGVFNNAEADYDAITAQDSRVMINDAGSGQIDIIVDNVQLALSSVGTPFHVIGRLTATSQIKWTQNRGFFSKLSGPYNAPKIKI